MRDISGFSTVIRINASAAWEAHQKGDHEKACRLYREIEMAAQHAADACEPEGYVALNPEWIKLSESAPTEDGDYWCYDCGWSVAHWNGTVFVHEAAGIITPTHWVHLSPPPLPVG